MNTILVTGGAGFIGSNFVRRTLEKHPDCRVLNVDALTYASNLENLHDVSSHPGYSFVKADIRDRPAMERLMRERDVTHVVNFAAESHVDRSIEDPEIFVSTNVLGANSLLEAARSVWNTRPGDKHSRAFREGVRFVQVSTDEVYGSLGPTGLFMETTPLCPNSPYSASKAAADLMARAYCKTFGLPVCVTRCSNNYGPYQFPEKLIPLMINNCLAGKRLPVYGDGTQVRDWLHVWDHCAAIDTVLHHGRAGEVYNVGGNNERANIEIVRVILRALGKSEDLIEYVKDRPGHDRRYAIDGSKIRRELGWNPEYTFEKGMDETIAWYLGNSEWMERVVAGDYASYYHRMYGNI